MIFCGNLYLGNHLDYFCIKLRSIRRIYERSEVAIDAQVLFRLFHTKIIQSHTATTSIVFYAIQKQNRGNPNPNLTQKDKKC